MNTAQKELDEFLANRNKGLIELDLKWARKASSKPLTDNVLLAAMHKARYECTDIADKLRLESRDWLIKQSINRFVGDFLPGDELPS